MLTFEKITIPGWEREISKAADALWDKYGSLCRGSDGQLYGVEYAYIVDAKTNTGRFIPAAWARVEKSEEETDND